jgi:signal transduction histidine kinase
MSLRRIAIESSIVAVALIDGVLGLYRYGAVELALTVVAALGLVLRRRWPWASVLLALPALFVVGGPTAAVIALYSLAASTSSIPVLAVAGSAVFLGLSGFWVYFASVNTTLIFAVYALMTAGGAIAIGQLQRTRHMLKSSLAALREAREHEHGRIAHEAAATERAHLAREMHDVVSNQVSLIAVQSGGLQVRSEDPTTVETARRIRTLAAATLDELRQMVLLLRDSDAPVSDLAPPPTVDRLRELLAEQDLPIESRLDLPDDLAPAIQRAVYRTIQEGLTNIRKHAPGARVRITATADAQGILVEVSNTRATEPPDEPLPSAATGHLGLAERAANLGGTLEAESLPDGSHLLRMRIPHYRR